MHRFTGGRGADVVFECAGTPDTAGEAFGIAGRGGTVVLMGICERPVAVDFLRLVTREILVVTALGKTAAEFGEAVELLSRRRVDLSPLLSRVIPLEAALEGFRPPRQGCGREIKILVSAVY
jgi:threonine dehydrogenase-like Zn-dependent dehydrogenase